MAYSLIVLGTVQFDSCPSATIQASSQTPTVVQLSNEGQRRLGRPSRQDIGSMDTIARQENKPGSGVRLEALDKGMEDAIERNGWLSLFLAEGGRLHRM